MEEQSTKTTTTDSTNETDKFNTPALNQAAYIFQTSLPRIKSLASNLSRNGLARVFKAVVEFPLAEGYPKFKGVEQELFNLSLAAIGAKSVMTGAFMQEQGKEVVQEAENLIVQEILTKEEKNNG